MVFMIVLPTKKVGIFQGHLWPPATAYSWSVSRKLICAQLVKNPLIATWKIYFPWGKKHHLWNILWLDYNGKSINVVDDRKIGGFHKWRYPIDGWFIMENLSINGWFNGTPTLGNLHMRYKMLLWQCHFWKMIGPLKVVKSLLKAASGVRPLVPLFPACCRTPFPCSLSSAGKNIRNFNVWQSFEADLEKNNSSNQQVGMLSFLWPQVTTCTNNIPSGYLT